MAQLKFEFLVEVSTGSYATERSQGREGATGLRPAQLGRTFMSFWDIGASSPHPDTARAACRRVACVGLWLIWTDLANSYAP